MHKEGDCIKCSKCREVRLIVYKNNKGQLISRCPQCRLGMKK